jgi:hypothetical protein
MQKMEAQLDKYNLQKSRKESIKQKQMKQSSGINLQQFLVPKRKGKHRRSFTNQDVRLMKPSAQLDELEKSFKIGNESDITETHNYLKKYYQKEKHYHKESMSSPTKHQELKEGTTENDYEHFYRRSNIKPNKKQLLMMQKLLIKMGRKLESRQSKKSEFIESRKSEELSKKQLHKMLTNIVDQLVHDNERNLDSNHTLNENTYKTFIEIESDKNLSHDSRWIRNRRGYHGFLHEDIVRSIVKLEGMMRPSKQDGFGEMGIIDRNGRLINEKFSELSGNDNITSILADSISRVKGLTGEMDWNKPFYQIPMDDSETENVNRLSMSQAQKKLDDLLEKHLRDNESEDEDEVRRKKEKVSEWEKDLRRKEKKEKVYKTVNLDRGPNSNTKFTKKRTSQRYMLNSDDCMENYTQYPKEDLISTEKQKQKIFTFKQQSLLKKKPRIFDFTIKETSQASESNKSLNTKDIQIPTLRKNPSFNQYTTQQDSSQPPTNQECTTPDEVTVFRKIETDISEKSITEGQVPQDYDKLKPTSQQDSERVQIKIYPQSKSTSKRVIANNWSAVNNTTNISLKVLDSRKNMSMIHNINFSKLVESSKDQKVPFNSKGQSLRNSNKKMVFGDSCLGNVMRGRISESVEKRSTLNPILKNASLHQSSRLRRINDLKDQKNKQNFMQKLLKNAGIRGVMCVVCYGYVLDFIVIIFLLFFCNFLL